MRHFLQKVWLHWGAVMGWKKTVKQTEQVRSSGEAVTSSCSSAADSDMFCEGGGGGELSKKKGFLGGEEEGEERERILGKRRRRMASTQSEKANRERKLTGRKGSNTGNFRVGMQHHNHRQLRTDPEISVEVIGYHFDNDHNFPADSLPFIPSSGIFSHPCKLATQPELLSFGASQPKSELLVDFASKKQEIPSLGV